MEGIAQLDSGTLQLIVIGVAAAAAVGLTIGLASMFGGVIDPVRRRLGQLADDTGSVNEDGLKARRAVTVDTIMGPMAEYLLPKEEIERTNITRKLTYAGFRGPGALQNFYFAKAGFALALPLLVYLLGAWMPDLSGAQITMYAVVAAGVGILAPNIVLEKLMAKRLKKLRQGFPDALDLMVVCVEAGLGLSQSIQRVSDELIVSHPELATELALVNLEMRAGVDSVTSLKNLAGRNGLDDINGLVGLLVQTIRFGTGVADSLRVYSEEFRDKRMQKAEEMAAKIGTKMIFPLIVFLFPGFFVVSVGPAVIALVDVFRNFST